MILSKNLKPECIEIMGEASNKDAILKKIAASACKSKILKNLSEDFIYKKLKEREDQGSTGIGEGIAIPHCRLDDIDEFVVGLIINKNGVDFDAIDNKKVEIFFFIIGPKKLRNLHIQILSAITKLFQRKETFKDLMTSKTPEDISKIVSGHLEFQKEAINQKESCILNIFIQNEDSFNNILGLLSADIQGSIAITEMESAGSYLHKLPLFSAFWTDENKPFGRIITAILDKAKCNDLIRRIHSSIPKNESDSGLLITAQDLFYSNGSLDF